jgi:hypothetical protein
MSIQLHAPAALPPEKEPLVLIGLEAEWAPGPVWTTWRKVLTLPGLELRPLGRPTVTSSYTDYAFPAPTDRRIILKLILKM